MSLPDMRARAAASGAVQPAVHPPAGYPCCSERESLGLGSGLIPALVDHRVNTANRPLASTTSAAIRRRLPPSRSTRSNAPARRASKLEDD